jgi:hypothetical protein
MRIGPSFTIPAGLRQRSHSQVRVPVSDSRLPQPRGPGTRIYIPQEQSGPVRPPGTVEVLDPASTRDGKRLRTVETCYIQHIPVISVGSLCLSVCLSPIYLSLKTGWSRAEETSCTEVMYHFRWFRARWEYSSRIRRLAIHGSDHGTCT